MGASWYVKPEWWAIGIAVLSLLFSIGFPIFNRVYPPRPKVKITSFLPLLTFTEQENGSMSHLSLKGIAEFYNKSDMIININEMVISGEIEANEKLIRIGNKTPNITIRISGNSVSDNIINNNNKKIIKYEFINFEENPDMIEFDGYIGSGADDQTWKVVSSRPAINSLIKIENNSIHGLSDNFSKDNLKFNFILGEKIIPIEKNIIMEMVAIKNEIWEDDMSLEQVYKKAKQKHFREMELEKVKK